MSLITSGTFPKALREGVFAFMSLKANKKDSTIAKIYRKKTSKKQYEEFVNTAPLGFVPTKPEGSPIAYDAPSQGYQVRVTHFTKALGFMITEEAFEDNLYAELSTMRGRMLGDAFAETRELEGHVVLNNAANPAVVGGDGVSFLANNHPSKSGLQSNLLESPGSLSEATLEALITQIMLSEGETGQKTNLKPISLIYHVSNQFNVQRIMKSQLQNDTANNATNALRTMYGNMKLIASNRLANVGHYGFQTDIDENMGFIHFVRRPFRPKNDVDAGNTNNMLFTASERYSFVVPNFRAYYGFGGA